MDIVLVLEGLVPHALYSGSLSDNDFAAYESITWEDERPKPSWDDITDQWDQITSREAQWRAVRAERKVRFDGVKWRVERYQTQKARNAGTGDTDESDEKYADLLDYLQALRDVTNQTDPFNISWPSYPSM